MLFGGCCGRLRWRGISGVRCGGGIFLLLLGLENIKDKEMKKNKKNKDIILLLSRDKRMKREMNKEMKGVKGKGVKRMEEMGEMGEMKKWMDMCFFLRRLLRGGSWMILRGRDIGLWVLLLRSPKKKMRRY